MGYDANALRSMSLADLEALNQRLGNERDAIRGDQQKIGAEITRRVALAKLAKLSETERKALGL